MYKHSIDLFMSIAKVENFLTSSKSSNSVIRKQKCWNILSLVCDPSLLKKNPVLQAADSGAGAKCRGGCASLLFHKMFGKKTAWKWNIWTRGGVRPWRAPHPWICMSVIIINITIPSVFLYILRQFHGKNTSASRFIEQKYEMMTLTWQNDFHIVYIYSPNLYWLIRLGLFAAGEKCPIDHHARGFLFCPFQKSVLILSHLSEITLM